MMLEVPARSRPSVLAQPDPAHGVVGSLLQNQVRALTGRQNVVAEIDQVDATPDFRGRPNNFLVGERGILVEVRVLTLEHAVAEDKAAVLFPTATLPAMPMMYGTCAAGLPRNMSVTIDSC